MNFQSTRDKNAAKLSAAQVIKQGLAADGGLFVPEAIPSLTREEVEGLSKMDYPSRAAAVLGKFLTDYTAEELLEDCRKAYAPDSFVGGAAPLHKLDDTMHVLELWHGPTAAFKDMALQIMPRLLSRALTKTGEARTAFILVATSGDTGKAALEGYKDIDRIKMMVFYPVDGVSTVQKLQMQTQSGSNVNVTAIRGNFDDAQTGVKVIFSDKDIAEKLDARGYFLSSANSINWGRLAPQIVYYVSAYCDLLNSGAISYGEPMNVTVPTGNFGNILAAYIAKLMGLPIDRLICASNKNNILTDFFASGTYDRNRDFHLTMSPSMDILISSNLERLLWFTAGAEKTAAYMQSLSKNGAYTVDKAEMDAIKQHFCGYYADEEKTAATIKDTMARYGYLIDTHTAVAVSAAQDYVKETGDKKPMVIASTASPYKFAADVYASLYDEAPDSPLAALDQLSEKTGVEIPYPLKGIGERQVRFTDVIDAADMEKAMLAYLQ